MSAPLILSTKGAPAEYSFSTVGSNQTRKLNLTVRREGSGDRYVQLMHTNHIPMDTTVMIGGRVSDRAKYQEHHPKQWLQDHLDKTGRARMTQWQSTADWMLARKFRITSSTVQKLRVATQNAGEDGVLCPDDHSKVQKAILESAFLKPRSAKLDAKMKIGNRTERPVRNMLIPFVATHAHETAVPIPRDIDETGLIVIKAELAFADSPDILLLMPDGSVEVGEIKTKVTAETALAASFEIENKFGGTRLHQAEFGTPKCKELVTDASHRSQLLHHASVLHSEYVWYIVATTSAILNVARIRITDTQRSDHLEQCRKQILPHLSWAYSEKVTIPSMEDFGWAQDKATVEYTLRLWRSWQDKVLKANFKPPAPVRIFKALSVHSWCKFKGGVDVTSNIMAKIMPKFKLGFAAQFTIRGLCYLVHNGIRLFKLFKIREEKQLSVKGWRQSMNAMGSFSDMCAVLFESIHTTKSLCSSRLQIVAPPLQPIASMSITPPKSPGLQWRFWSDRTYQASGSVYGSTAEKMNGVDFRLSQAAFAHLRDSHVPVQIGRLSTGKGFLQRACFLCSRGSTDPTNKVRRVYEQCNCCKVALCIAASSEGEKTCFERFHQDEKLERPSQGSTTSTGCLTTKSTGQNASDSIQGTASHPVDLTGSANRRTSSTKEPVAMISESNKRPRLALRRLDLNVQEPSPASVPRSVPRPVSIMDMDVDEDYSQ